jgi:hypothetical protein
MGCFDTPFSRSTTPIPPPASTRPIGQSARRFPPSSSLPKRGRSAHTVPKRCPSEDDGKGAGRVMGLLNFQVNVSFEEG